MRAKFVNETLGRRPQPHKMIELPEGVQDKYEIPDFALQYDGLNPPEAAEYVDGKSGYEPGDVVESEVDGGPVVVILIDDVGTLATKAHNIEPWEWEEMSRDW